jgi:hypothetical protein
MNCTMTYEELFGLVDYRLSTTYNYLTIYLVNNDSKMQNKIISIIASKKTCDKYDFTY